MNELRVGFAKVSITPPLGLPMDGYDARTGKATGVLEPLFARACYLADATSEHLLLCLEVLGISTGLAQEIQIATAKVSGVRAHNVIVAATHTHSGPTGFASCPDIWSAERAHVERCLDALRDIALSAKQTATPAQLTYRASPVPGVAGNRVNNQEAVDESVRVLHFTQPTSGETIGVIAMFACHPTILGADNVLYSGDLFGRAAACVEEELGRTCLLVNGAEADVSTRFTRKEQTPNEVERLGGALARVLLGTLEADVAKGTDPVLRAAHRTTRLFYRTTPPLEEIEELVRSSERSYREAVEADVQQGARRQAWTKVEGARNLLRLAQDQPLEPAVTVELTGLRIGPVVLLPLPGEAFTTTFRLLERRKTEHLALIPVGLSNGYLGYFPTEAAVNQNIYEALTSPFDPATTAHLVDELGAIVDDLAQGAGSKHSLRARSRTSPEVEDELL